MEKFTKPVGAKNSNPALSDLQIQVNFLQWIGQIYCRDISWATYVAIRPQFYTSGGDEKENDLRLEVTRTIIRDLVRNKERFFKRY